MKKIALIKKMDIIRQLTLITHSKEMLFIEQLNKNFITSFIHIQFVMVTYSYK